MDEAVLRRGAISANARWNNSIAILTGTREDEVGMISGLNSTGHEIGGTLGIAIFSTIAGSRVTSMSTSPSVTGR